MEELLIRIQFWLAFHGCVLQEDGTIKLGSYCRIDNPRSKQWLHALSGKSCHAVAVYSPAVCIGSPKSINKSGVRMRIASRACGEHGGLLCHALIVHSIGMICNNHNKDHIWIIMAFKRINLFTVHSVGKDVSVFVQTTKHYRLQWNVERNTSRSCFVHCFGGLDSRHGLPLHCFFLVLHFLPMHATDQEPGHIFERKEEQVGSGGDVSSLSGLQWDKAILRRVSFCYTHLWYLQPLDVLYVYLMTKEPNDKPLVYGSACMCPLLFLVVPLSPPSLQTPRFGNDWVEANKKTGTLSQWYLCDFSCYRYMSRGRWTTMMPSHYKRWVLSVAVVGLSWWVNSVTFKWSDTLPSTLIL